MPTTKLIAPLQGETVKMLTDVQREFYKRNIFDSTKMLLDWVDAETEKNGDLTRPAPVIFKWETDAEKSVLKVSKNADLTDAKIIETTENEAEVYNFEVDTVYYWSVNDSEVRSFRTEDVTTRWMYIDGCVNVRDCGSWKLADGSRIKQGLIFRGTKLEDSITEKGIEQMKELGIKTEIDLRAEAVGKVDKSEIGDEVKYHLIPCGGYDDFFEIDDRTTMLTIFNLLADKNNYPIYFHCYGGADRTGTIAFLLGAILGVPEEKLISDYEITMLAGSDPDNPRRRSGYLFQRFIQGLNRHGGNDIGMCEKAVNALYLGGVSRETMDKIREIFAK